MAVINGNNNPNILLGTEQGDTMHALGGDDIVYGNGGNDHITGGLGDDTLYSGAGDDVVNGEAGNDRLVFSGPGDNHGDGGDGTDTIEIDLTHLGSNVHVTTTWNFYVGALTNYGFVTSDQSSSTYIDGYERLIIRSGAGDDRLNGTRGKDTIYGNDGDDSLGDSRFGGNDIFYGGRGDDYLIGNSRNDRLFGGTGDDVFEVRYTAGNKAAKCTVDGGNGQDQLRLFLGSNKDQNISFETGAKNILPDGLTIDRMESLGLWTGSGDDTLSLKITTFGSQGWSAGAGTDHATLDLSQTKGQAAFNYGYTSGLGNWTAGGEQTSISLRDIESLTLIGNDQQNNLGGGEFENLIRGGGGNDTISGGRARDQLFGEDGRDVISGADGDDLLDGGAGMDGLFAGNGNDILLGGADKDRLYGGTGDDQLDGGTENDRLHGEAGKDQLDGGAGNDHLNGGSGDDTLRGGADSDRLVGASGNDTLDGGTENDWLRGEAGEDILIGGAGRDRLVGGIGDDDLTGGLDGDWFIFRDSDGTDRILDFELGRDRIDLRRSSFEADDLIFAQKTGYVEVTFDGDTSAAGTTIQVLNVTVAELDNSANFLF
ncbi:MAG: hypothetical protein GJ676_15815 [Rhodobacteraceae bacterium]|nr:hypothetical protein [Paracoccaceae bacterium]